MAGHVRELTLKNENIEEECCQYFPLKCANPFLSLLSKMVLEAPSVLGSIEAEQSDERQFPSGLHVSALSSRTACYTKQVFSKDL